MIAWHVREHRCQAGTARAAETENGTGTVAWCRLMQGRSGTLRLTFERANGLAERQTGGASIHGVKGNQ